MNRPIITDELWFWHADRRTAPELVTNCTVDDGGRVIAHYDDESGGDTPLGHVGDGYYSRENPDPSGEGQRAAREALPSDTKRAT